MQGQIDIGEKNGTSFGDFEKESVTIRKGSFWAAQRADICGDAVYVLMQLCGKREWAFGIGWGDRDVGGGKPGRGWRKYCSGGFHGERGYALKGTAVSHHTQNRGCPGLGRGGGRNSGAGKRKGVFRLWVVCGNDLSVRRKEHIGRSGAGEISSYVPGSGSGAVAGGLWQILSWVDKERGGEGTGRKGRAGK